jgi:hypothetical protein
MPAVRRPGLEYLGAALRTVASTVLAGTVLTGTGACLDSAACRASLAGGGLPGAPAAPPAGDSASPMPAARVHTPNAPAPIVARVAVNRRFANAILTER